MGDALTKESPKNRGEMSAETIKEERCETERSSGEGDWVDREVAVEMTSESSASGSSVEKESSEIAKVSFHQVMTEFDYEKFIVPNISREIVEHAPILSQSGRPQTKRKQLRINMDGSSLDGTVSFTRQPANTNTVEYNSKGSSQREALFSSEQLEQEEPVETAKSNFAEDILRDDLPPKKTCGRQWTCSYKSFVFIFLTLLHLVTILTLVIPSTINAVKALTEVQSTCVASVQSIIDSSERTIENLTESLAITGSSALFHELLYNVFFQPCHMTTSISNTFGYMCSTRLQTCGPEFATYKGYVDPFDPILDIPAWQRTAAPLFASMLKSGLFNQTSRAFMVFPWQYIDVEITRQSDFVITSALSSIYFLNSSSFDSGRSWNTSQLFNYLAMAFQDADPALSYYGGRYHLDILNGQPSVNPETNINPPISDRLLTEVDFRPLVNQYLLKLEDENRPLVGEWSPISRFYDTDSTRLQFGYSWSWPWAPCGNYSCLHGAIGAVFTAGQLSLFSNSLVFTVCSSMWAFTNWLNQGVLVEGVNEFGLKYIRKGPKPNDIGLSEGDFKSLVNFTLSYLTTVSANASENGLLMAASVDSATLLNTSNPLPPKASESPSPEINMIQQALERAKLHLDPLTDVDSSLQVMFDFRNGEECSSQAIRNLSYCVLVAASPLETPNVVSSPSLQNLEFLSVVAFPYVFLVGNLEYRLEQEEEALEQSASLSDKVIKDNLIFEAVLGTVFFILGMLEALLFSLSISRPLNMLRKSVERLRALDFRVTEKHSSRFVEISDVQKTFGSLRNTLRVVEKFIPRTVVRQIIRNENNTRQVHTQERIVTVVFSDLGGFTSIAEKLPQADLSAFLMSYLSQMSKIIETYEGTVAEIQGDGILAFWNTPDFVEDHASKACAAAVAAQQALRNLNKKTAEHLKGFDLPPFSMRIGIHTGKVLTGIIGSSDKYKWGCIGDPCNLASRLEGICKLYGTGIICSGDTHALLSRNVFLCRELDVVRVKGKKVPTKLFEVVGVQNPFRYTRRATLRREDEKDHVVHVVSDFLPSVNSTSIKVQGRIELYEAALHAYQAGRFPEAKDSLKKLCSLDTAAEFLMTRIKEAMELSPSEVESWDATLNLLEKSF